MCLLHLLHEGFELSELVQERLVCQVLDVLSIVVSPVGSTSLVYLLEALWLAWVDAFQNTQTPTEIWIYLLADGPITTRT